MAGSRWVAYVGPFLFPWGQPGSRRVYWIAKALVDAGYVVVVGSGDDQPCGVEVLERCAAGELRHVGLAELHQADWSLFAKAYQFFVMQGDKTVRWLDAQPTRPSHVIVYGGYAPFISRMLSWCRRHRVALVADVVEWYDSRQLAGGFFGPYHASTKLALRYLFPRCDGVIAISALLERYYRSKGVLTIRVPPTLDVSGTTSRIATSDSLSLSVVYAGTPGRKDLLRNVIDGVAEADPEGTRISLTVLGPELHEVLELCGARGGLPRGVNVSGRVPQPQVAEAYRAADFSVLLREPLRFAQAGFPTKVPESLAVGTPIICNATSDLAEYIRDGEAGLLCADHSPKAFATALRRALSMTSARRADMRRAARSAAEASFDYRNYSNVLDSFLMAIRHRIESR